jgi:hypothetical protein
MTKHRGDRQQRTALLARSVLSPKPAGRGDKPRDYDG